MAFDKKQQQLEMVEKTKKDITNNLRKNSRSGSMVSVSDKAKSTLSKEEAIKQVHEMNELKSRIEEDERIRAVEDMIQDGDDPAAIVILPEYELDERLKVDRECKAVPENVYMGLGWDVDRETGRKHYRKFFTKELENVTEIFEHDSPFNTFIL